MLNLFMNILNIRLNETNTAVSIYNNNQILKNIPKTNTLVVTDSNCQSLFQSEGYSLLVLPPGESAKHFASIQVILEKAVELGLDRKALFVAVGGGVICDMTAFAASIYLRGTRLILCPTTLLSMVDASVGGKTGIDFCNYKNQVGTFFPAEEVRIAPDFLLTLPTSEYLSGLGEVIKTALLKDKALSEILLTQSKEILARDIPLMTEVIQSCLKVKGYFVENDFKEGGIRAYLNLGHTFGHALETLENLGGITHGEGVAWGIYKAAQLSTKFYDLTPDYLSFVKEMLLHYNYRLDFTDKDTSLLIEAMKHDKKKVGNNLRFTIQKAIGETAVETIPEKMVQEILETP